MEWLENKWYSKLTELYLYISMKTQLRDYLISVRIYLCFGSEGLALSQKETVGSSKGNCHLLSVNQVSHVEVWHKLYSCNS